MMYPIIGAYRLDDKVRIEVDGVLREGKIICIGLNGYVVAADACVFVVNDPQIKWCLRTSGEKEPTDEIKVGDRVRTLNGMGKVVSACDGYIFVELDSGEIWFNNRATIPEKENKPTDEIKCGDRVQTPLGALIVDMIAGCNIFGHYENGDAGIWTKEELSKHKSADHNDNTITIPVKADLDDTYWDAYKAELAKELAVELANEETITSPATADYITDFVTQIVDNLKKQSE